MKDVHYVQTHAHVSGSLSDEYLEYLSEKNKRRANWEQLQALRKQYAEKADASLIWQIFGKIASLVQTTKDVTQGVVDIATHSVADHIELRTTPKDTAEYTWRAYVAAFVLGLQLATQQTGKTMLGLLSIDRSRHDFDRAKDIVDAAAEEKQKHGLIRGIDISGNFLVERKVQGGALGQIIKYALEKDLCVAIHVGEAGPNDDAAAYQAEKEDTDAVLQILADWKAKQPDAAKNPLHGRARLGHAIYLTPEQQQKVRELGVPIEICPTCHKKLHWWVEGEEHPVAAMFRNIPFDQLPLTVDYDDSAVFDTDIETETRLALGLFKQPISDESIAKFCEQQRQFLFGLNPESSTSSRVFTKQP